MGELEKKKKEEARRKDRFFDLVDQKKLTPPVEDNRKPGDPNPPEIKEKVNQDMLKTLIDEMGFEEMNSEKALFKTDNQGVEFAVNWLAEHGEDADIDLPMLPPPVAPPPKPKMS